ncbi:hypothetical protein COU57_02460 [Candidatus Pacearchaeota archaeon CG10_big_fil_rev_8_21_14_0_10_32_14]|nr:MAG: hypothetical protein COU57_02460 [Candidatus Pacearchaeota archaeon CG10_big_fil_rev_8_21_14_0_10_32_14]
MSLSLRFYQSQEKITEEIVKKLVNHFDNKENPTEVSLFREGIIEGTKKYKIFRIGKIVTRPYKTYKVENDSVVPIEDTEQIWEEEYAYFKMDSDEIYVEGSGAGWVSSFISRVLFGEDDKIELLEIDLKKLEEDIKKKNKFRSIGTGFIDNDGTKVRLTNFSGLDLEENRHIKGCEIIEKQHIDIIIEKDGLEFKVLIYPDGKVTFLTYKQDRTVALRIFLKIWEEIKPYS